MSAYFESEYRLINIDIITSQNFIVPVYYEKKSKYYVGFSKI